MMDWLRFGHGFGIAGRSEDGQQGICGSRYDTLRPISLEFECLQADHFIVVPKRNDQDAQLDLNEAIDSLLVEIEDTTNSYAPPEEQAIDSSMMITDDGTAVAPPEAQEAEPGADEIPDSEQEPKADTDAADSEVESEADVSEVAEAEPEVVDSIENAHQALEALDEVESQAEDLVAQSVDALLESSEASIEDDAREPVTPPISSIETPQPDPSPAETAVDQIDPIDGAESPEKPADSIESVQEAVTAEVPAEQKVEVDETTNEPVAPPEPAETAELQPTPINEPEAETPESQVFEIDEGEFDSELSDTDSLDDSMDMLDNALAEAAGDMLDGDFETEEGDLVTGEAVATAIEKALETQPKPEPEQPQEVPTAESPDESDILGDAVDDLLGSDEQTVKADELSVTTESPPTAATAEPVPAAAIEPTATDPVDGNSAESQEAAPQEQGAQAEIEKLEELHESEGLSVPAWFERSVEVARPKIDKIDPLKGKTMDALAFTLGSILVATMTHATPIGARLTILISKPLAKQSPEVRNALGYIALWTGFLAVVLWVYLLMFRTPNVPHPETAPSRVINADESLIVAPLIPVKP